MKKMFSIVLSLVFLASFLSIGSAKEISEESNKVLSYEEYFSQRRFLANRNEQSFYQKREGGVLYINGEYGNAPEQYLFFPKDQAYTIPVYIYEEAENGIPSGAVYLGKRFGDQDWFLLGSEFDECMQSCGYLYAVKDSKLQCYNLSTLESWTVYSALEEETICLTNSMWDDVAFFIVNERVYRYYRPSDTLDMVYENSRLESIQAIASDVLDITLYSPEYLEIAEKAGVAKEDYYGFPKDPIAFYTWLNERFSKSFKIPTEEEVAESNGEWGSRLQTICDYTLGIYKTEKSVLYDVSSSKVISEETIRALSSENTYYGPDVPSPWLGNSVEGLPEELNDAMVLVPSGAYWSELVNQENLLYTSLGNNQARALLSVLMEKKGIVRPEKRELLTAEAQVGKERIPAAEVQAVFESLYGTGSFETMKKSEVIGDANGGDLLLKTMEGDYVYCWAPYGGSELNAEQYIKYLSHETDGEILTVDTVYGYYRLDDGRETYRLYGDARPLRWLEVTPSEPIASGNVGDGILTKLRNGELDGSLTVYRHTFRRNSDGSYAWVSSIPRSQLAQTSPKGDTQASFKTWGIWICTALAVSAAATVCGIVISKKKHG